MRVLRTSVVEEVLDDVVPDGEERTARRVSRSVDAIRACNAAGERSCGGQSVSRQFSGHGEPWRHMSAYRL